MQLKRILHHAGWFTLLGPFVGVPAGIVTLAFFEDGDIGQFYFDVARTLMLIMFSGWFFGAIPALLTGIAVACLPAVIYDCHWRRVVCSGMMGIAVALIGASIVESQMRYFLAREIICAAASAGGFAGLVMGWSVVTLSGFSRSPAQKEYT